MTNITKAAQDALTEFDAFVNADDSRTKILSLIAKMDALRAALQDKAGEVPADGWLQDGGLLYRLTDDVRVPENRDEINVTMADGSRSHESRARRAGELLDRIRAAQPAPVVPDPVAMFDAAVEQELPLVSHVQYDSHEICKHFAANVRKALAASQQKGG